MAELQDVLIALKKADAAGNTEDAQKLAALARQIQAQQTATETQPIPQGGTIADSLGKGLSFGFADELAGAGGALVNSALGVFGKGTGDSFSQAYTGIRDAARENEAAFASRNPGTALAAEIAGGIATGGVGAARAGAFSAAKNAPTLLGKLRPIIGTGAVQGGLFGAGVSGADSIQGVAQDTAKGALIGGATAPILPVLAGGAKATIPKLVSENTSRAFQKSVQLLRDKAGVVLTTAQKTGSDALTTLETTLAPTFVGQSINRAMDRNRLKFQSKLMRMAGFKASDASEGAVTREALDNAQDEFSKRYKELLGNKKVDISGDDFLDKLAAAESENLANLTVFQKKQIGELVDNMLDTAIKGPMTAKTYQLTRSRLGKLAQTTKNTQPHLSSMYRSMKIALDDAFADAVGQVGVRTKVDTQYGRFKQLLNAFEGTGSQQSSEGILPLSMIVRRSRKAPDREFEEMVTAGQMVLGDATPNSGTASRALNNALAFGSVPVAGLDPTLGIAALGVPFGVSQMLSRGVTGSGGANRAIQSGLITSPIINPLLGGFQEAPPKR